MSEIRVRVLDEEDWQLYREVRLAALRESPHAFTATYAEESVEDEAGWRRRMASSARFLALRGSVAVGVVSLGRGEEPGQAEIFGLYVVPQARDGEVSWRLVQEASDRARTQGMQQLSYWVGTENARAIAFAANFGFRPTGERRTTRLRDVVSGDQEVAMVLPLMADPASVPNPASGGTLLTRFPAGTTDLVGGVQYPGKRTPSQVYEPGGTSDVA